MRMPWIAKMVKSNETKYLKMEPAKYGVYFVFTDKEEVTKFHTEEDVRKALWRSDMANISGVTVEEVE